MKAAWICKSKDNDSPRGNIHVTVHGGETLCGKKITEGWYIYDIISLLHKNFNKKYCKKCLIEFAEIY